MFLHLYVATLYIVRAFKLFDQKGFKDNEKHQLHFLSPLFSANMFLQSKLHKHMYMNISNSNLGKKLKDMRR